MREYVSWSRQAGKRYMAVTAIMNAIAAKKRLLYYGRNVVILDRVSYDKLCKLAYYKDNVSNS